jgi:hypothetical protein
MTIQPFLLDVIKQCGIGKVEVLKVSPADQATRVQSYDDERVLFIDGLTHHSVPEITGEFGLFNFKILKGLLTLSNFQTDNATFKVGTRNIDGVQYPDRIEFKGGGTKATFRLMSKEVVPEQPTIVNIPWDISFTPSVSKVAEFQQMASLYSDVEGMFVMRTDGTDLVVDFGNDSSSTHSASMIFEEGVSEFQGEMKFPIDKFLMLMKAAKDAKAFELKLTSRGGLLGVVTVTDIATYNYYLKKSL